LRTTRAAARATRRKREPPTDAEIERGLRERATSDARAAEILRRWLQRPHAEERVRGVDLESMSERELERLHASLLKLAALPDEELRAPVDHCAGRRRARAELMTSRSVYAWKLAPGRHPARPGLRRHALVGGR
jgi:hypothetical protein